LYVERAAFQRRVMASTHHREQFDEIVRTDETFNRWPLAPAEEVYEDEICPLIST
jgi:hypothetical protein